MTRPVVKRPCSLGRLRDDIMTTMTLPGRLMRPVATPPARRATLIGFGATLLGGLLIIAAVSAAIGFAAAGAILPGVSVGGVELSGLTPPPPPTGSAPSFPSLSAGQAVLVVGDEEATVGYDEIGRGYETQAMVDAAFGIGRDGNPLADGLERLRSLANPVDAAGHRPRLRLRCPRTRLVRDRRALHRPGGRCRRGRERRDVRGHAFGQRRDRSDAAAVRATLGVGPRQHRPGRRSPRVSRQLGPAGGDHRCRRGCGGGCTLDGRVTGARDPRRSRGRGAAGASRRRRSHRG